MTRQAFGSLCPGLPEPRQAALYDAVVAAAAEFRFAEPRRMAMMLAQAGHETMGFLRMEESFAYTAARLFSVFPRHFATVEDAKACAERGPEAIASRVYASRMGNGPEPSGDGWAYRGRGFFMLTGRANYRAAEAALGVPLLQRPALAAEPRTAARVAGWYWAERGLSAPADRGDVERCTRLINGGVNGLPDRVERYAAAKRALGVE